MKLSHLTIAISAAIGLAACGGSGSDDAVDNNTNPTTPTNPTPTNPTPTDPTPSTPDVDQNGLEKPVDPKRQVPTGEVEVNVKPQVDAAKKAYVDRQTRDSVTGYNIIQGGGHPVSGTAANWPNRTATKPGPFPNVESQMTTVQDNTIVKPAPFEWVELANRPNYAKAGDISNRNRFNKDLTSAVAARTYRNAGYEAYANQWLDRFQGTDLINPEGQAGLIFYTGSTKVNNPTNSGNGDLQRDASIINYASQTPLKANGGIQANPDFSYAKIGDNYYRVIPEDVQWSDIAPDTTFQTVVTQVEGKDIPGRKGISMDKILFIPNAATGKNEVTNKQLTPKLANGGLSDADNPRSVWAYKGGSKVAGLTDELGTISTDTSEPAGLNIIRGSQLGRLDDYSIGRGNVEFQNFTLAGKTYSLAGGANFDNVPLDLSAVPSSRENKQINEMKVGLNYDVLDSKATGQKIDDHRVHLTAEAGALKIYELPYHRTIVSINQAAVDGPGGPLARASNMFGFAGYNDYQGDGVGADGHFGPYQVLGYNQGTLPENGRADYRGKSFGVNSVGDLALRADFGKDRASVYGSVQNRKRLDGGAALPDMKLHQILLSQPAQREHYGSMGMISSSDAPNGIVSLGSNANWGTWAMSFYGPNAEEVGGVIAHGEQLKKNYMTDVKEVFSGERGRIIGSDAGSASGSLN